MKLDLKSKPILPHTQWVQRKLAYHVSTIDNEKPTSSSIDFQKKIINSMSFELYVYLCLFQSYKAIVRHLKKTCLHDHKACISNYIKHDQGDKYCHYAVAYARWRQELECKIDAHVVNHSSSKNNGFNERQIPSLFSVFQNPFLSHILTSKIFMETIGDLEAIKKEQQLWPCVAQLINKVFCHFIMQKYYDWVTFVSKKYPEDDSVADALYYPEIKMGYPVIFIKLDIKTVRTIIASFYWANKQKLLAAD